MSDTRTDCGFQAFCEQCGQLADSMFYNGQTQEGFERVKQHVRETGHRVFVPSGNIVSLGDPD